MTGQSLLLLEPASKRLHLLKELLPAASRVAVFACAGGKPGGLDARTWDSVVHAARTMRLQLLRYAPKTADEIRGALQQASRNRAKGLLLFDCPAFNAIDRRVLLDHRLPAIYYLETYARSGGLMAYGPDEFDIQRRSVRYLDRILRGAKPSELPVEQATRFRFVINLNTAKALAVTVPPTLLDRADEVIQ